MGRHAGLPDLHPDAKVEKGHQGHRQKEQEQRRQLEYVAHLRHPVKRNVTDE